MLTPDPAFQKTLHELQDGDVYTLNHKYYIKALAFINDLGPFENQVEAIKKQSEYLQWCKAMDAS